MSVLISVQTLISFFSEVPNPLNDNIFLTYINLFSLLILTQTIWKFSLFLVGHRLNLKLVYLFYQNTLYFYQRCGKKAVLSIYWCNGSPLVMDITLHCFKYHFLPSQKSLMAIFEKHSKDFLLSLRTSRQNFPILELYARKSSIENQLQSVTTSNCIFLKIAYPSQTFILYLTRLVNLLLTLNQVNFWRI